ncbi:hypothetical protein [Streptomyces sp. NPDC002324]
MPEPPAATGPVPLFAGALTKRLRRGARVTIAGDLIYLALALCLAWGPMNGLQHGSGAAPPDTRLFRAGPGRPRRTSSTPSLPPGTGS